MTSSIKPLLSLHNEVDDSDVFLTCATAENAGPFVVELVYNDPAICTVNVREEFTDMGAAIQRFTALVQTEIQSVEDEVLL